MIMQPLEVCVPSEGLWRNQVRLEMITSMYKNNLPIAITAVMWERFAFSCFRGRARRQPGTRMKLEFNTEAAVCQKQVPQMSTSSTWSFQNHHGNEQSNAKPVNSEFPQHNIGTKSKMLFEYSVYTVVILETSWSNLDAR